MILTREERKRLVLDLYNQGKGTHEIAKELNVI
jgi:DNA-binding NarL/FixJ family response regulator